MTKCFCDRCNKELDYGELRYVALIFHDLTDNESVPENWEFCKECASSIKHAIAFNIAQYKREGKR